MTESASLSNKEKALIALAAAMGGGCRTCAEGLYGVAALAGAAPDEVERAFCDGLRVRESATDVMRHKAATLMGRAPGSDPAVCAGRARRITELGKLAAAAAANSSPDARHHKEAASAAGATEAEVRLTLGIARAVRTKAQGFSDAEIGDGHPDEVSCSTLQSGEPTASGGGAVQQDSTCCG